MKIYKLENPNPSEPSGDNVSVLVSFCTSGAPIVAQVYNMLGSPIGSAITITSDGQAWDRLEISAPSSAGTYYIQVTAPGYSNTLGYTVF